ncbi:uncharacterized protein LOC123308334 [Coccinella septempunctata]|uniref:uncharacterized protein LOC123308334 n=1 Tax=Coccinella septempunctata TaxID=41139 RepID=UPI001D0717D0|nr:uncharacterized protein LOC123308334 [Coccinella septempunctata]
MRKINNCCVPGCMDRVSQRHRFPKANPTLFKTWLEVIKPQNWQELSDEQIYNRYYVCHVHFTKNYHLPGSKRGLTIDAVPTIDVPGTSFETVLLANEPKLCEVLTEVDTEKTPSEAGLCEVLTEVDTEKTPSEAGPSGIEKSTPEDGPNNDFMEPDIQEPVSDSVMNKKKIQKGVRKSILTRLQYTRTSQLTAKEKIMYSMLKEYNARISQLKYRNKCLRQKLVYAKRIISSRGFQRLS